jgi:acyl-CoA thioester hydrolase
MIEKKSKKLSASMEWISLYIDLNIRRVTEFEKDKIELMDDFIDKNKDDFDYQDLRFASKLKK